MPTRQFEHEFEFDTGAHVPVHAAADAAVAAVPLPRFSTFLSLNVPTPQPTSSSTRPTLGPSLARTPVPTCGQRPRRNPRLRLLRCPRCNRLNCPRCCQRHCHRPSPRCISPPRLRLRLHRNRRPCRRPTELFSCTCSDPAAELRPRSKTHARSLAGAYLLPSPVPTVALMPVPSPVLTPSPMPVPTGHCLCRSRRLRRR
jgi:hypothetical protein